MEQLSAEIARCLIEGRREEAVRLLVASGSEQTVSERMVKELARLQEAAGFLPEPERERSVRSLVAAHVQQELMTRLMEPLRKGVAHTFRREMTFGLIALVTGVGVTIATSLRAAPGEMYVVATGAMVVGLVAFLKGLIGWVKYSISPRLLARRWRAGPPWR